MAWVQLTDFGGTARWGATSFVIGTKGYVCCGIDASGALNDLWQFDFVTKQWSQKASLPGGARYGAVSFAIGSYAYVGLGKGASNYTDFYRYDPSVNQWTQIIGTNSHLIGAVGFSVNGYGYITFGSSSNGVYSSTVRRYDPNANPLIAWTSLSNTPAPGRYFAACFVISNVAYIVGGDYGLGKRNDTWSFNGTTWTQKDNFGGGNRGWNAGFALNSKGYVCGGLDAALKNDLWMFDPAAGAGSQWSQKETLPGIARYGLIAFASTTKGYCGLGNKGSGLLKDWYEYDSATLQSLTINFTHKWSVVGSIVSIPFIHNWSVSSVTPISFNFVHNWSVLEWVSINPPPQFIHNWQVLSPVSIPITFKHTWEVFGYKTISPSPTFIYNWTVYEPQSVTITFVHEYEVKEVTEIEFEFIHEWEIVETSLVFTFRHIWEVVGYAHITDIVFKHVYEVNGYQQVNINFVYDYFVEEAPTIRKNIGYSWYNSGIHFLDIGYSWEVFPEISILIEKRIPYMWKNFDIIRKRIGYSWEVSQDIRVRYKFFSEKRQKDFKRAIIQRMYLK